MKLCILIPVYDHEGAIEATLMSLKGFGFPCILVDDGSHAPCAAVLQGLAKREASWLSLLRLEVNQGKGGAVMAGAEAAAAHGYSHLLQIDADGQHASSDLPRFLAESESYPEAVICGEPRYGAQVPKLRLYGRLLTSVWIWINCLSFEIHDAMCGFRIYPLQALLELIRSEKLGRRMDFDPEILVRLHWKGLAIRNIPTPVSYPLDGRSHFRLLQDNWLISRMHARLFFGMLARFPALLWKKWQVSRSRAQGTGPKSPSSAPPGV
jgi:glycosyltransferase involved in cell wall biosynthesis